MLVGALNSAKYMNTTSNDAQVPPLWTFTDKPVTFEISHAGLSDFKWSALEVAILGIITVMTEVEGPGTVSTNVDIGRTGEGYLATGSIRWTSRSVGRVANLTEAAQEGRQSGVAATS